MGEMASDRDNQGRREVEKRLDLALDTSTSTEYSSLQKQPCVEDKFALKSSVAHDCMNEGAGISTSIHRNVLEGANIVTQVAICRKQVFSGRHKYVQEVPSSSAPVQCDDRLEQLVATGLTLWKMAI
ncbi:hypothetical protein Tco_0352311 [Tanacetum coccineum]